MSISQAAVSSTSAFPFFQAEEPPRRPGQGPAFAAAMAESRPTPPKQRQSPGPATEDKAPDVPEDEVPPDETAAEAETAGAEDATPEDQPSDGKDEPVPEDEAPFAFFALPLGRDRPDAALALVPGGFGGDRAEAEPAAPFASAAGDTDADPAEILANAAGKDEVPVVAAQIPFLRTATIEGDPGREDALPAPDLQPVGMGLSVAAQATRAASGFGLGLSVLRAGTPGREQPAETLPELPALPRLAAPLPAPQIALPAAPVAFLGKDELTDPGGTVVDAIPEGTPLSAGSPGTASVAALPPAAAPVQATPTQLAPLVLAAARQNGPADITVTLSPEELGTLHLRVAMDGDSLRVTMLADRPETLDLLRRHGEQLLAELRTLGFGGASLGFGSSGGNAAPKSFDSGAEMPDALPAAAAPLQIPPAPSRVQREGGLDLRL